MFPKNITLNFQQLKYRPDYFFYSLLVVFIAANGVIIPIGRDWTAPQIMAIAMIGFFILRQFSGSSKVQIKVHPIVFILLTAWLLLLLNSMYFAPEKPFNTNPKSTLQSYGIIGVMYFIWILLDIMLMWVVYRLVSTKEMLIKTVKLLIYSSVFYSIYGIYQYVFASLFGLSSSPIVYAYNYEYIFHDYTVRLLSLSREPLYFANFICPVIIVITGILISNSSKVFGFSKVKLQLILLVNLLGFFLTKSTGGFIAMTGALLLILVIHYKSHFKSINFTNVLLGIGSVLLLGMVFYYFFGTGVERKIVRFLDPESGYMRIVSIYEALDNIAKKPFTGFGLGNAYFLISVTQIHNAYLNIAAETGLISLFCFVSFLIFLFFQLRKAYKIGGRFKGLVLGITGAFIYVLVQWLSFYAYIVLFAWFLFGIILALPKVLKSSRQKIVFIDSNII